MMRALPLGSTAEHLSGLFYIQEASSMLPVAAWFKPMVIIRSGSWIWQRRAVSKTADRCPHVGNRGATSGQRIFGQPRQSSARNISRCGIANTALTHLGGRVFGAAFTGDV